MEKACGATHLKIFGDSQLVAQQVMNKCDAVNDNMIAYRDAYNELEGTFDGCEVNHVSRFNNDEADILANIGLQCPYPQEYFGRKSAIHQSSQRNSQHGSSQRKRRTSIKRARGLQQP
jgi:ribonuclease HI